MAKRKPAKTQCFCGSGGERWYLCFRWLGGALCRLAEITTYQEIHALKTCHRHVFAPGLLITKSADTLPAAYLLAFLALLARNQLVITLLSPLIPPVPLPVWGECLPVASKLRADRRGSGDQGVGQETKVQKREQNKMRVYPQQHKAKKFRG